MLPRPNRLPAVEIARVMKTGRRVVKGGMTLVYKKSLSPRFAFIVSTKVDKRATVRNRIRRLMSESVRLHVSEALGIDGIFIGSKQLVGKTQQEVNELVLGALHEAIGS